MRSKKPQISQCCLNSLISLLSSPYSSYSQLGAEGGRRLKSHLKNINIAVLSWVVIDACPETLVFHFLQDVKDLFYRATECQPCHSALNMADSECCYA